MGGAPDLSAFAVIEKKRQAAKAAKSIRKSAKEK